MTLKNLLAKSIPGIGYTYRHIRAYLNHYSSIRDTYSQFGEDAFILKTIACYEDRLKDSLYVDVGAYHPSQLSNTYLLYRAGYRGILLEPNPKLNALLKKFRPADYVLEIAASDRVGVLPFTVSSNPVLSSLHTQSATLYNSVVMNQKHVPVMRVDEVVNSFNCSCISVLSIDVEGLNYEVLRGASEILDKTFLLCIEFDTEEEHDVFTQYLSLRGFKEVAVMGCNAIYQHDKAIGV